MTETWVPGVEGSGFGLEHLPYGVVQVPGEPPHTAVRVGLHALLLQPLVDGGLLTGLPRDTFAGPVLNPFLALGRPAWDATRARLVELLADGAESVHRTSAALVPLDEVEQRLPVDVGDYVDFYSSLEHASNVGRIFRPDAEPLKPNWRHLPVGYHGRAASVVVSGTPVRRPSGQLPQRGGVPAFGPTGRLDVELELGFFTGPGNPLGTSIAVGEARERIFGFALVNDWSARDIQRWEYEPLGPFLGKSFATSVAAWITPLAALEPFRVPAPPQDPEPLPYLRTDEDWALDIELEIVLEGTVISRTNARGLYWTAPQQLAHATVNGANARPGDLFASGTISGPAPGTYGSLLELTWGGRLELELDDGARRAFLEDGDTVSMRGRTGDIALAEVTGTILPP